MNDINISSKNTSSRRIYQRRNRKKNTTDAFIVPPTDSLSLTTTPIITTAVNSTLLVNSSSVPINDLFASVSYFTQHKYVFIVGLFLLIFLCIISIVFIIILKCARGKNGKTRQQKSLDKKRVTQIRDFLDDQNDHKEESVILLDTYQPNYSPNNNRTINGIIHTDNISNTFSIDPMLEKKIIENNPPNSYSLSPAADDTSLDTLRGSLISSPSQHVSVSQQHSIPSNITTTDSTMNPEEHVVAAEKDDDLHDLDLKRVPRYVRVGNSTSNLSAHRTSASSIEQTIRARERREEEKERGLLHGSNSNLYEKEYRQKDEREKVARKEHNNSQVSLTSRTSEDSCY